MTGKLFKMCAIGAVAVGLNAFENLDAQAAVTYQTVAVTGDPAPGTAPGVLYSRFFPPPVLNNAGQTAFSATVTGTDVDGTNNLGIWSEGSGSLDMVSRKGATAPGVESGVVFNNFFTLKLSETGQTAFQASLKGQGVGFDNNFGLWLEGSGSLGLFARVGNAAPGTGAGVQFLQLTYFAFSESGQITSLSRLKGPGVDIMNRYGIWSDFGGSQHLVVRAGDVAPGAEPEVFTGFNSLDGPPAINGSGQVAFHANITNSGVDPYSHGIWSDRGGSLAPVVMSGAAAPDMDPGVTFVNFEIPLMNDAGQIAFFGSTTGPGIDLTNSRGIWSEGGGSLTLAAREGDAAPNTEPGVLFDRLYNQAFNNVGQIALMGRITGPTVDITNDYGIWSEDSGSLRLIVRSGDAAPGTVTNVLFGALDSDDGNTSAIPFYSIHLNSFGQIAFLANLVGQNVNLTNNLGIWATDLSGELTLIVRNGDLFDINDDPLIEDLRRVRSISMNSGVENGKGFNDAGQVAFALSFTDGSSGIFVATVPEPASLTVLIVGTGLILSKRSTNLS